MVGSKSVFATLGSSNHSKFDREEDDYYSTDPSAITLFHNHNLLDPNVHYWECACGGGSLTTELRNLGYSVPKNTDLFNRGFGEYGINFLECDEMFEGNIITNPPFSLLTEFILKGLELAKNKLYIFGRIQTIESQKRYDLIFKEHKPKYICPFVKRISCYRVEKEQTFKSSAICYAWFIWDNKEDYNETKVKWLI